MCSLLCGLGPRTSNQKLITGKHPTNEKFYFYFKKEAGRTAGCILAKCECHKRHRSGPDEKGLNAVSDPRPGPVPSEKILEKDIVGSKENVKHSIREKCAPR